MIFLFECFHLDLRHSLYLINFVDLNESKLDEFLKIGVFLKKMPPLLIDKHFSHMCSYFYILMYRTAPSTCLTFGIYLLLMKCRILRSDISATNLPKDDKTCCAQSIKMKLDWCGTNI